MLLDHFHMLPCYLRALNATLVDYLPVSCLLVVTQAL